MTDDARIRDIYAAISYAPFGVRHAANVACDELLDLAGIKLKSLDSSFRDELPAETLSCAQCEQPFQPYVCTCGYLVKDLCRSCQGDV